MNDDDEQFIHIPWDQVVADDHRDPAFRAAVQADSARQQHHHDLYHQAVADLATARALTRAQLCRALDVTPGEISRIEQKADLVLSTIARHVSAAGGSLQLLVEFGDRESVVVDIDALGLGQQRPNLECR